MQATSALSSAAVTERYRSRLLARQAGTFADATSPSVAIVPPGRRPVDVLGPNGLMTNVGELTKQIFARRLPHAEKFRAHYGRLDMAQIQHVLQRADVGIMTDLADLTRESMSLDPHCLGIAQKRFGALSALDHTLDPATGPGLNATVSKTICEGVRSMVAKIKGFRQGLYDLAWAKLDGRGALEIDWRDVGGRYPYRPAGLEWIHPRRIGLGPARELRVINTFTSGQGWWTPNGVPLNDFPGKFIQWMPRDFSDYPEREGLGRRSLYWMLFKRFAARMRMIHHELFAIPRRVIEFPQDTDFSKTDYDQLDEAEDKAEALGGDTVAAMPPGAKLDVKWPGENSGQLFTLTIEGVDDQLSKLWLGNTATTDAKADALGGAMADVHKTEQGILLGRDALGLTEAIQEQLIDVIVVLNWGAEYLDYSPTFQLRSKTEINRKAEQDLLHTAVSFVTVPEALYRERTGIKAPEADEPYLTMVEAPLGWDGRPVGAPRAVVIDPKKPKSSAPPALPPAPPLAEGTAAPPPGAPPPSSLAAPPPAEGEADGDAGSSATSALKSVLGLGHQHGAGALCLGGHATANGSPETLVSRGVKEGARLTGAWAAQLCAAVHDDHSDVAIHRALSSAADSLSLDALARSMERTITLSLALGALDSAWEVETEQPIQPPVFSRRDGVFLAGAPAAVEVSNFVLKPFAEAIQAFVSKKVVSRRLFDRLSAEAKRRSFTIAGLAKKEMLSTAHDELSKAIIEGADLRTFRDRLGDRFDSAGWTQLNKSHVETVYRNAVVGSYASGRDVQMSQPEVLAARPYWQILGVDDDRTRPTHKAVHRHVLAASDSFWKRAPLPWGHNDRCRKISRSAADLTRLGLSVTSGTTLKGLPDEGWDASGSLLTSRAPYDFGAVLMQMDREDEAGALRLERARVTALARVGRALPIASAPWLADHPARALPLSGGYDPGGSWLGWIEPETGSWIAFIAVDGHALLWEDRDPDGGVVGNPFIFERPDLVPA